MTGTFSSRYFEQGIPGTFDVTFSCAGEPTCQGSYSARDLAPRCSNAFAFADTLRMTGLNLSSAGPIQGELTLAKFFFEDTINADGTCTMRAQSRADVTLPYSGHWNGTTGSFTLQYDWMGNTAPITFTGTFTATRSAPPPVFPMVVTATVDVTATASAQIQYRSQDVGTQGSVYVFATAPAAQVRGGYAPGVIKVGMARNHVKAFEKAESCVISQLNAAGQLVAVTFAQLQAFLSGTLSAQGASVNILDRVPTGNVAGATFYVGYGTSAQRMINDGIFRSAVLVPGNDVCPMIPSQTALWWNPREPGWGINLAHQGATIFGTLFTYDAARTPMWLVMSAGRMQSDGKTYTGDLFRTTGPAFNANPFTPIGAANVTRVGTMSLRFSEANSGTLTYTVNDVQVVKDIQPQVYGSRAANCLPTSESRATSTNYQDLWWNPDESGWGLNLTHQDQILFATLFTYDASGRDLWLVMSSGTRQADGSYLGDLYQTSGNAFNAPGPPSATVLTVRSVGSMRLRFTDGNNGTLSYTYNGVSVTKSIQRQVFNSTFSTCN